MPKGIYPRSKTYKARKHILMKEVMNRPEIREYQRKKALERWERYREKKISEEIARNYLRLKLMRDKEEE